MAKYNSIDEWIEDKLNRISDKQMEKAYFTAVQNTIGKMGVRIFEYGISSSGRIIGSYQSGNKPLYVSNFNSPRNGTLKGKSGKRKFKNKKTHRTTYYPNYKSFREAMGRQTSNVNLRLSGQLYRNFLTSLTIDNVVGARPVSPPSKATPVKIGRLTYAIKLSPLNMAKAIGAEEHFGKKIFDLTRIEKEDLQKTFKFELIKNLT